MTCAGFAAPNPYGQKIGEPRHLKVEIGGLFAARSVLILVCDIAIETERRILSVLQAAAPSRLPRSLPASTSDGDAAPVVAVKPGSESGRDGHLPRIGAVVASPLCP